MLVRTHSTKRDLERLDIEGNLQMFLEGSGPSERGPARAG